MKAQNFYNLTLIFFLAVLPAPAFAANAAECREKLALPQPQFDYSKIGRQFLIEGEGGRTLQYQVIRPTENLQSWVIRNTTTLEETTIAVDQLSTNSQMMWVEPADEVPVSTEGERVLVEKTWGPEMDARIAELQRAIAAKIKFSGREIRSDILMNEIRAFKLDRRLARGADPGSRNAALAMMRSTYLPVWKLVREIRPVKSRLRELENRTELSAQETAEKEKLAAQLESKELLLGRIVSTYVSLDLHIESQLKNPLVPESYKQSFARVWGQLSRLSPESTPTREEVIFHFQDSPLPTLSRLQRTLKLERAAIWQTLRAYVFLNLGASANPSWLPERLRPMYRFLRSHAINRSALTVHLAQIRLVHKLAAARPQYLTEIHQQYQNQDVKKENLQELDYQLFTELRTMVAAEGSDDLLVTWYRVIDPVVESLRPRFELLAKTHVPALENRLKAAQEIAKEMGEFTYEHGYNSSTARFIGRSIAIGGTFVGGYVFTRYGADIWHALSSGLDGLFAFGGESLNSLWSWVTGSQGAETITELPVESLESVTEEVEEQLGPEGLVPSHLEEIRD